MKPIYNVTEAQSVCHLLIGFDMYSVGDAGSVYTILCLSYTPGILANRAQIRKLISCICWPFITKHTNSINTNNFLCVFQRSSPSLECVAVTIFFSLIFRVSLNSVPLQVEHFNLIKKWQHVIQSISVMDIQHVFSPLRCDVF